MLVFVCCGFEEGAATVSCEGWSLLWLGWFDIVAGPMYMLEWIGW